MYKQGLIVELLFGCRVHGWMGYCVAHSLFSFFLIIPWLYEIVEKTFVCLYVCVCFDRFTPVFKPKTGSDSELDMCVRLE